MVKSKCLSFKINACAVIRVKGYSLMPLFRQERSNSNPNFHARRHFYQLKRFYSFKSFSAISSERLVISLTPTRDLRHIGYCFPIEVLRHTSQTRQKKWKQRNSDFHNGYFYYYFFHTHVRTVLNSNYKNLLHTSTVSIVGVLFCNIMIRLRCIDTVMGIPERKFLVAPGLR